MKKNIEQQSDAEFAAEHNLPVPLTEEQISNIKHQAEAKTRELEIKILNHFPPHIEKPWRNHFNCVPDPGEILPGLLPSLTVKDQTMSLRDIVERHRVGLPAKGGNSLGVPLYDQDNELPDPRFLDLAERQGIKEQLLEEVKNLQDKFKKEQASNQEKAAARKKTLEQQELFLKEQMDSGNQDKFPKPGTSRKAPDQDKK